MRIFDSHCHPQFPQYDQDREEMLKRAREAGVGIICVGTDFETSKSGIELAQRHDNMWATVGLHPNDVSSIEYLVSSIEKYENLMSENKVIAIGEVGLDYYRTPEPEKQDNQKRAFGCFVELAIKYKKPMTIHSRDSARGSTGIVHKDLLDILDTRYKIQDTNVRGVAHSFTGSVQEAQKYLELGFCLGFNGIITFAQQYDEMVKSVPLERILLETDAPYLTPEPHRGQRNEPAYVVEVAKKLSELKNIPLEVVIEQTTKNCKNLFQI